MLRKVERVGIRVRDLDRSIKFYTEILGLPLRKRPRLNETTGLAFLFWRSKKLGPRPKRESGIHDALIAAITQRDPDAAEQAACAHVREALEVFLRHLGSDVLTAESV